MAKQGAEQEPQEFEPEQKENGQEQNSDHTDSPSNDDDIEQSLQDEQKSQLMDNLHQDERLSDDTQRLMQLLEDHEKNVQKQLIRLSTGKQKEQNGKKNW